MPLSRDEIKAAFEVLSNELHRDGTHAEIIIVGGAALVLMFGARESTKDVDAFFVKPEAAILREAAKRVAARMQLPDDWLNDSAKGYLVGVTTGEVLHASESLLVRAASLPQLLAMKLAAWRDAIDREDAKLLLIHLSGSAEAVWALVRPYVPQHQSDKASYAFDDLWESVHGHS